MCRPRQDLSSRDETLNEWHIDPTIQPHIVKQLKWPSEDYVSSMLTGKIRPYYYDHLITTHRGGLAIWHLPSGQCKIKLPSKCPLDLSIYPDGRIAALDYRSVELLSLRTGKREATLTVNENTYIYKLIFLPHQRLALVCSDHTIKILDQQTRLCASMLYGHTAYISQAFFLPNGLMISGSHDGTIKVWDTLTSSCLNTLQGHQGKVTSIQFLLDGRLASSATDSTIKLWNLQTGRCEATMQASSKNMDRSFSLLPLPHNRLAGYDIETIYIWNLQTGQCEMQLNHPGVSIHSLYYLPDGHLASGGLSGISLWNLETRKFEATVSTERADSLQLLSNGHFAYFSLGSNAIKILDIGLREKLVREYKPACRP